MGTRPFTGSIKTTYFIYFPKKWEIIWYADDIFFPNENRLWIIILNTHQFHEKIAGFSIKKKLGTTPHWLKQYLDDEKDDYVVDDLVIWQGCTYLPKKSSFLNILGEMK